MFSRTNPYVKSLGNSLTLKSLGTEEDIERLAAFNSSVHQDARVGDMTHALVRHHPHTSPPEWLFVEDDTTGAIVSSLCLIPWTWHYGGVAIRCGEMGIVGTDPNYRNRGLIRALDARFKELLDEGGYVLSHIQGIPYYYRQFGYEYAIPLEGGWEIELRHVPDEPPAHAAGFSFRLATEADIPALAALYDESAGDLDIHAVRDEATWRYLFEYEASTQSASQTWLVLGPDGSVVGYWRTERYGFGTGLTIGETSRLSHDAAVAVLVQAKKLATDRSKPYIRLALPYSTQLVRVAQQRGGDDPWKYAWQIYIPDPARLLRAIGPVLERRLAVSAYAGLTQTVVINRYRDAYALHFEHGQLVSVDASGSSPESTLSLPPHLLAPLVLGYRSRAELRAMFPDVSCHDHSELLIDTLFPPMKSFVYTAY